MSHSIPRHAPHRPHPGRRAFLVGAGLGTFTSARAQPSAQVAEHGAAAQWTVRARHVARPGGPAVGAAASSLMMPGQMGIGSPPAGARG